MAEEETQSLSPQCRRDLKKLLNKLKKQKKEITIIIRSGANCCELTGCLGEVDDCFAVLIDPNDVCQRTHILLDCICAVKTHVGKKKK